MSERYRGVLAGAVSGILAGIIMGIVSMLVSYRTGMGLLLPLHMVAATFYGVGALVDGAGVAAIGLIIHLVVSAFFGVVFALLTQTNIAQRGPLIRGGASFCHRDLGNHDLSFSTGSESDNEQSSRSSADGVVYRAHRFWCGAFVLA